MASITAIKFGINYKLFVTISYKMGLTTCSPVKNTSAVTVTTS